MARLWYFVVGSSGETTDATILIDTPLTETDVTKITTEISKQRELQSSPKIYEASAKRGETTPPESSASRSPINKEVNW
jgi:hypothetical protein